MDIQLEKTIIKKLAEVTDEFVAKYEANLKPMTQKELIQRALEAEGDIKNGRHVELETWHKPAKS